MSDKEERLLERRAFGGDREAAALMQDIKCRRWEHVWKRSEQEARDCGCPADPGIHRCQILICDHCEITEEEHCDNGGDVPY